MQQVNEKPTYEMTKTSWGTIRGNYKYSLTGKNKIKKIKSKKEKKKKKTTKESITNLACPQEKMHMRQQKIFKGNRWTSFLKSETNCFIL